MLQVATMDQKWCFSYILISIDATKTELKGKIDQVKEELNDGTQYFQFNSIPYMNMKNWTVSHLVHRSLRCSRLLACLVFEEEVGLCC